MASIDAAVMMIIVGVAHGGLLHIPQGGHGGATSSQNFVSLHYGGHYHTGGHNLGQVHFDGSNSLSGGIGGSEIGVQYVQGVSNGFDQTVGNGGQFGQEAIGGYSGISHSTGGQALGGELALQQIGQDFGGAEGFGGEQGIGAALQGHGAALQGIAAGDAGLQNIAGYSGQGFGGLGGIQNSGGFAGQEIGYIAGDLGTGIETQGADAPYPAHVPASTYGLPSVPASTYGLPSH